MATRRPLVVIAGVVQELPVGDTVEGSSGGSSTTISGTAVLDFGDEGSTVVLTISSAVITNAAIKGATFLPQDTAETSLTEFAITGVTFSIENIVDGVSFDIRGSAIHNATGNHTVKYIIIV